jgi:hypothetical protein
VQIVFEAIPHTEYKLLITKHPAPPEQAASAAARRERVAVSTRHVRSGTGQGADDRPGTGLGRGVRRVLGRLSDGQLRHLWTTALGVQMQITTLAPRSEAAADLVRTIAAR